MRRSRQKNLSNACLSCFERSSRGIFLISLNSSAIMYFPTTLFFGCMFTIDQVISTRISICISLFLWLHDRLFLKSDLSTMSFRRSHIMRRGATLLIFDLDGNIQNERLQPLQYCWKHSKRNIARAALCQCYQCSINCNVIPCFPVHNSSF